MGTLSVSLFLIFAVNFVSSNIRQLHVPVGLYERGYAERVQGKLDIVYNATDVKCYTVDLMKGLYYKTH